MNLRDVFSFFFAPVYLVYLLDHSCRDAVNSKLKFENRPGKREETYTNRGRQIEKESKHKKLT